MDCKDGRLCGRRGSQLESDRKPQGATSSDEREAIMRAMRQASDADSAVLWRLLESLRRRHRRPATRGWLVLWQQRIIQNYSLNTKPTISRSLLAVL